MDIALRDFRSLLKLPQKRLGFRFLQNGPKLDLAFEGIDKIFCSVDALVLI